MLVFWVATLRKFVGRYQLFGGTYLMTDEDGGSTILRNVGIYGTNKPMRRYNLEDQHLHLHCRANLRFQNISHLTIPLIRHYITVGTGNITVKSSLCDDSHDEISLI
jgi:hypothetical protein